jgi:hypothetical protein
MVAPQRFRLAEIIFGTGNGANAGEGSNNAGFRQNIRAARERRRQRQEREQE